LISHYWTSRGQGLELSIYPSNRETVDVALLILHARMKVREYLDLWLLVGPIQLSLQQPLNLGLAT